MTEIITCTNIKFDSYIFYQFAYYLSTVNSSLDRLLELSLISKSWFNLIQSVISSYQFNSKNKFMLDLPQFIKYINYNNNNNYKFKIIQFKDIELIKIGGSIESSNKLLGSLSYYDGANQQDTSGDEKENLKIYNFLKLNCQKLKNVVLLDTIDCNPGIKYDYTFQGYFIINSLRMIWNKRNLPISNGEVVKFSPDDYYSYHEYPFSFQFLLNYNPIELIVGTMDYRNKEESRKYITQRLSFSVYLQPLILENLINILNCKSIESIQFQNHPVNKEFLELVLNKSKEQQQHEQQQEQQEKKKKKIIEPNITNLKIPISTGLVDLKIKELIELGFENNKTLKKLTIETIDDREYNYDPNMTYEDYHNSFRNADYNNDYEKYDEGGLEFSKLIQFICLNKSINTLGLNDIYISGEPNVDSLKPLLNAPNIHTIESDYLSFSEILNHSVINNNIKEIIIHKFGQKNLELYFDTRNGYELLSSSNSTATTLYRIKNNFNNYIYITITK